MFKSRCKGFSSNITNMDACPLSIRLNFSLPPPKKKKNLTKNCRIGSPKCPICTLDVTACETETRIRVEYAGDCRYRLTVRRGLLKQDYCTPRTADRLTVRRGLQVGLLYAGDCMYIVQAFLLQYAGDCMCRETVCRGLQVGRLKKTKKFVLSRCTDKLFFLKYGSFSK